MYKEISSCVLQRFDGFSIIRHMPNKKEKEDFQLLDIVYKPVKTIDQIIECYFTDQTNLAYRAHFQQGKDRFQSTTAEQCYYCNVFVSGQKRLEKHLKVCGKKPGITYKFNNEYLNTFEDNFKLLRDLPFTVYIDLERTCGKNYSTISLIQQKTCILFYIVLLLHLTLHVI